ncbi:MAG: hypothetical protein HQK65_19710 [Desulfamplus sp.]|nr:hypothetical protein [Desulfamplus sp.]
MKFKHLFENWNLTGLKIKTSFLEMEWKPQAADKDAAWELYVELLTRVTTQALEPEEGTEEAALSSIHSLFKTTREVLKHHGRECVEFSKVAVIILNQVVRPFTSKWHQRIENGTLNDEACQEFRANLLVLQERLISYTHMLSEIAGVEDITSLESEENA